MPDFEFSKLKCLRNIAVFFAVVWGGSSILHHSNILLPLYKQGLGSIPSHLFVSQLAKYQSQCGNKGVLFIGPSTVREGFDEHQFQQLNSMCSINAGVTSHGSIYHIALLLDIVQNLGINPQVLVLGINSRMLSDRMNPITENRYVDFLKQNQIEFYRRYEYQEKLSNLENDTWINTLFPLVRYSIRLDYLIRNFLRSANLALGNYKNLGIKSFSRGNDMLVEPSKYSYADKSFNQKAFLAQIEDTKRVGFMDPAKYGWNDHIRGLNMVLERASEIAPKVIIVIMPEHSEIRKGFGAYADQAFYEILGNYNSETYRVLDYSESIDDRFIRDMAHLTATGRHQLTIKISTIINSQ